jgi:hypothetical protein
MQQILLVRILSNEEYVASIIIIIIITFIATIIFIENSCSLLDVAYFQ